MIKISGGKYRSRMIEVPPSITVPTKAMTREAIASAIKKNIPEARVLDLFAGSGALGIEMLSRGAASVTFVDASKEVVNIIKNNLSSLKETHYELLNEDFRGALSILKEPYDIVFLDPPYKETGWYQEAIHLLLEKELLKDNACIVLEYEGEIVVDETPFREVRSYRYGRSKIKILWR